MAKNNKSLHKAHINKNDEWYTKLESKTKSRCTKITFANSRAKQFYVTAMIPNGRISSFSSVFTSNS